MKAAEPVFGAAVFRSIIPTEQQVEFINQTKFILETGPTHCNNKLSCSNTSLV